MVWPLGLVPILFCCLIAAVAAEDPPEITLRPRDQQVKAGGIAAFYCAASGVPTPVLQWRKNGKRVSGTQSRYQVQDFPEGGMLLRIEPVRVDRDRATYECVAENGVGDAVSAEAVLTVYEAALMKDPPETQENAEYVGSFDSTVNRFPDQANVKKVCGAPSWSDDESQPSPPEVVSSPELLEPARVRVTPHTAGKRFSEKLKESERAVAGQLDHFLQTVRKSRPHFGSMAESLCSDDTFADTRDTPHCWNGHRVSEYTKTVVAAGVSAQKYNPELPLTDPLPDEQIRDISDNLRNMRQMMMRLLTRQPESDSYMRDEEGSGDGGAGGVRYPADDEEDGENWDRNEGSGSGEQPIDGSDTGMTPEIGVVDSGSGREAGGSGGAGAAGAGTPLQTPPYWLLLLPLCILHRHLPAL